MCALSRSEIHFASSFDIIIHMTNCCKRPIPGIPGLPSKLWTFLDLFPGQDDSLSSIYIPEWRGRITIEEVVLPNRNDEVWGQNQDCAGSGVWRTNQQAIRTPNNRDSHDVKYIKSHNTYNLTLYSSSSVVTTRITVVRSMCPSGSSYQQEEHQQVKYNWHKISLLLVKKIRSYAFHTCMTWGCDRQFAELKCKLTMLSMNKQFLNLNQSIIQYRGVHNINSIQICWKSLKLHFGKTVF